MQNRLIPDFFVADNRVRPVQMARHCHMTRPALHRSASLTARSLAWLLAALGVWPVLHAAPRLDVFPGYANTARLGTHYPVALELQGDGPTLRGFVELSQGQFGGSPIRIPIELPPGTTKRIVVPLFSSTANFAGIEARVVNEFGKVVAENKSTQLNIVSGESVLFGLLPGSVQNAPAFPDGTKDNRTVSDIRPLTVRFDPGLFPDNPLALEGLNGLYLNSRRALELKEPQVIALQSWVANGGHVIVAIENPTDVNATPWMQELLPAKVGGVASLRTTDAFHKFLRSARGPGRTTLEYGSQPVLLHSRSTQPTESDPYAELAPDPDFARSEISAVGLIPAETAETFLTVGTTPLGVSGRYGRGLVTALAFNPEQEPFKSWKQRPWFFARLASVPNELLTNSRMNIWGGHGIDTVFGAMIETRQIRKLPVGVLLLLLVVYLVVIGPFDQWWLKKINRPMLTWITFPSYVALFSLLIYFIGFKLRSGQSEYSELQVVDILPRGKSSDAALRGRSYANLYSPANNTYQFKSELPFATLRGEFRSSIGVRNESGRLDLMLGSIGFEARTYVPVWTAQGYVGDWQTETEAPLKGAWEGGRLTLKSVDHKFANVWVVHEGRLFDLGPLGAGGEVHFTGLGGSSESLPDLLNSWSVRFKAVASGRENTFGDSSKEHIEESAWAKAVIAASFCGQFPPQSGESQREWMWALGFDLTPNQARGDTLVMAWQPDETAVPRMNKFTALRGSKSVMYRLALPNPNSNPAFNPAGQ